MKISDLTDIRCTAAQRAETVRISAENAEFLSWAHKYLKAHGWVRTADSVRSAMFSKGYERGQRKIVLHGWHGGGKPGTNRFYGPLKLLFGLGDNQPNGVGPRNLYPEERMTLNFIDGTTEDADKFLQTARNWIMELK